MTYTRDDIHDILLHPERHEWQVQGFGMLRTYLDGPNEPRLQVWDQRLATWSNNAIHDHPWAFTSTIYAGMLYNQRYSIYYDMNVLNGCITLIKPGTRGGLLSERPVEPCWIEPKPVEVYALGDTYSQTHREMHLTRYLQGTVTLIERTEREEADVARVAWFGAADAQPPFVNPYPPSAEQIERTIGDALDQWFVAARVAGRAEPDRWECLHMCHEDGSGPWPDGCVVCAPDHAAHRPVRVAGRTET